MALLAKSLSLQDRPCDAIFILFLCRSQFQNAHNKPPQSALSYHANITSENTFNIGARRYYQFSSTQKKELNAYNSLPV